MRGRAQGLDALPWGAFVFDYFTAVPLSNELPDSGDDIRGPEVDQWGLRVHGRINLNAAPWKVLAGLPLLARYRLAHLPDEMELRVTLAYGGLGQYAPIPIGPSLAKAIAAYRDGRLVPAGGYSGDYYDRVRTDQQPEADFIAGMRQGRGFLSVGELANVRYTGPVSGGADPSVADVYRMDYGNVYSEDSTGNNTEDYFKAIGLLVGLEDWVTVRSHVYTIYGVIQGATMDPVPAGSGQAYEDYKNSVLEAESKAIRFQETVNRLPCFFDRHAAPERIGALYIGRYRDSRGE
jgi:hypothetical protein